MVPGRSAAGPKPMIRRSRKPGAKAGKKNKPMERALRVLVAVAALAALVHIIVPGIWAIVRG